MKRAVEAFLRSAGIRQDMRAPLHGVGGKTRLRLMTRYLVRAKSEDITTHGAHGQTDTAAGQLTSNQNQPFRIYQYKVGTRN